MDVWRVITWSGDLVFWFGMAVVLFLKHRKQKSMKLVFGLIANSVFALALKYVFLVPREAGFGPSFPSFHAQTAFFVSTFASMIYPNLA
ncbi:MAG: hypothetical protein JW834_05035, partial [Candidatus Diapherotrites archaeon]|nr:hypothetical protein [Candidatus Diapherotrites archaeon]